MDLQEQALADPTWAYTMAAERPRELLRLLRGIPSLDLSADGSIPAIPGEGLTWRTWITAVWQARRWRAEGRW